MIRDRMPDLCAIRRNSATFGRGFLQDVYIQISQNKKLNKVLVEVEEIRTLIQLIINNIAIVKDIHDNVLSHINRDIRDELESRSYTISQTALHVGNKLKEMGKDVEQADDLTINSVREGPAYVRIKILQYTTMCKLFSEVMQDYNESLIRYHCKCISLLQNQRVLTRKIITDEELDKLLDAQKTNLFVDNILEDSRAARQQLSDVETRHNELLKIEKSITEIRDLFIEMAFLIDKQGEQLNCVEFFAGTTTSNVDSGRKDLGKAEKRSHKHRKRKIKIIVVVSVTVIILLLIAIFL